MSGQNGQQQEAIQGEVSWSSATLDIMSPKKMIVESATMIYIIAFMLFSFVILVWKGPSLGTGEMMAMFFGLILTKDIAIRQYASFRY
jgi:positive regulator of sigma E activity